MLVDSDAEYLQRRRNEEDVGHHAIAQHKGCELREAAQTYEQVASARHQGKHGVAQPKPLQAFWEPAKI